MNITASNFKKSITICFLMQLFQNTKGFNTFNFIRGQSTLTGRSTCESEALIIDTCMCENKKYLRDKKTITYKFENHRSRWHSVLFTILNLALKFQESLSPDVCVVNCGDAQHKCLDDADSNLV